MNLVDPTNPSSQQVFGWDPASFLRTKTLDACVTPGFLPSALRAALRAFKIAPDDFVAGMTQIFRAAVRFRGNDDWRATRKRYSNQKAGAVNIQPDVITWRDQYNTDKG